MTHLCLMFSCTEKDSYDPYCKRQFEPVSAVSSQFMSNIQELQCLQDDVYFSATESTMSSLNSRDNYKLATLILKDLQNHLSVENEDIDTRMFIVKHRSLKGSEKRKQRGTISSEFLGQHASSERLKFSVQPDYLSRRQFKIRLWT